MRKHFYNIFAFTLLLTICSQLSFAQTSDNGWSFEGGVNAVDLYPVGKDAPQGEFFEEFFNINDHWNSGYYLGITKGLTNNLSLTATGTVNEISKWGSKGGDNSILVDNLKYYGLDAMVNYNFGKGKLQPFLAAGAGYTWMEEGMFNTPVSGGIKESFGGGFTANGAAGLNYWFSDMLGLKLQSTYKHSFEENNLPRHWSHNLGFVFKPQGSESTEEASTTVDTGWSFQGGVNAIDVYPVGEDMPQGEYFDQFFNVNDHWNPGYYLAVSRSLTDNLSFTASGTVNELSKWGSKGGDESILVDNLKYYGLDGMVDYSFGKGKLQPFLAVGGGYTWIEEGAYNTPATNKGGIHNFSGAPTVNGSLGAKYWLNDRVGINAQSTYKHSFEDNLPKHWSHNVGLVYKLGKTKVEEVSNDRDEDGVPDEYDLCPDTFGLATLGGCPDTDGDGIADKDDLCPNVKGAAAFGGCPDTDGDGFPDNKDNCPKVKGTDHGCPVKVVETAPVVTAPVVTTSPFIGNRKVYFDTDSSVLDENAKAILNNIVTNIGGSYNYNISVEGHTDSRASDNYNLSLARARALAVKNYLVSKNLSNSSISINTKGESQPAATNNTETGRALNRRAELTINITAK